MFLIDTLQTAWVWLLPFLLVLTVLVFIHELGHYTVARMNGVKVDVFSIGFGPEIFGCTDKTGTRWKFSLVPLGGYVKMFGDANEASAPDQGTFKKMTDAEKAQTLEGKTPLQKIAVSIAGPFANILLTFILLVGVYMFYGKSSDLPIVGETLKGSPAEVAGILPNDRILNIDGQEVSFFKELYAHISNRPGATLKLGLERGGEPIMVTLVSDAKEITKNTVIGSIGIKPTLEKYPFLGSIKKSSESIYQLTADLFLLLKNIVVSGKDAKKLGSILSIAKMSKDSFFAGIFPLLYFMAILSLNIGIINILPIPMLDGGHIIFYIYEMVTGKKPNEKIMDGLYKLGFVVLIGVMLFTMWNDLMRFKIIAAIVGLFK